jgi:hypothetical protein
MPTRELVYLLPRDVPLWVRLNSRKRAKEIIHIDPGVKAHTNSVEHAASGYGEVGIVFVASAWTERGNTRYCVELRHALVSGKEVLHHS